MFSQRDSLAVRFFLTQALIRPKQTRGAKRIREFGATARVALIACGEPALERLYPLLSATDPKDRLFAAEVIGEIPSGRSVPHLQAALARTKRGKKLKAALEAALHVATVLSARALTDYEHSAADQQALGDALTQLGVSPPSELGVAGVPALTWTAGGAVPQGALAWLLTRLSQLRPGEPDPNVRSVAEHLSAPSADALWSYLRDHASESRNARRWVMAAGDVLASPQARFALGEELDALWRADHRVGKQALELLRHDACGVWLVHWSRRGRTSGLRDAAWCAVSSLASAKGMAVAEFVERTLPRLGFDSRRRREFFCGGEAFSLELDASNALRIFDADGEPVPRLPRGAARQPADRPGITPAQLEQLERWIQRVAEVFSHLIEDRWVNGRPWTLEAWRAIYSEHPLAYPVGRALVWERVSPAPNLRFMWTDEGEAIDLRGEPVALPPDTTLRLAHTCDMSSAERGGWRLQIADVDVTPSIPQLADPPPAASGVDPIAACLAALPMIGAEDFLRSVARLGYERGPVEDAGHTEVIFRAYGGVSVEIRHDSLHISRRHAAGDSIGLTEVCLSVGRETVEPAQAPPRLVAEALRVLHALSGT